MSEKKRFESLLRSTVWMTIAASLATACAREPAPEGPPPTTVEEAGLPAAWLAEQGFEVALPEDVGMSSHHLSRIDEHLEREISRGKMQGAVTAVARRGKVVHFKAHGLADVDRERPMELDSIFRMASSSKPVLGVAAMIAIEEGLFSADDEVAMYLPEFADMQVAVLAKHEDREVSPEVVWLRTPEHRLVPAKRPITIHDLLTHTAGLGGYGLGTAVSEHPPKLEPQDTLAEAAPLYAEMILDFQPGSRWSYSAYVGLDVVARILEVVTDQPYEEFLRERIFEPLGMNDTHFFMPAEKESRRVVIDGLDEKVKGWDKPSNYASASGGLSSTAADYLRFEQMLIHQGTLGETRILSPESVATMTRNHVGDLYQGKDDLSGQGFGYTVAVVLDPEAAKSPRGPGAFGWGGAFGTVSWTDPSEDLTAIYLVQQGDQGALEEFEAAIREAILD